VSLLVSSVFVSIMDCKCCCVEIVYILFLGFGLGEVGGGDAIFVGLHVIVFFP